MTRRECEAGVAAPADEWAELVAGAIEDAVQADGRPSRNGLYVPLALRPAPRA